MDLFSEIEEPEREELKSLRKELEEANYKYYVLNMPTLSDREFDEKMHRLQELEAQYPDMFDPKSPTQKVGSDLEKPHPKSSTDGHRQSDRAELFTPQGEEKKPLGGIGHLAAFSFHETKNITAGGEGGLLVVNDERFVRRAEIIWEKGTNRAEFFRGEVNKYGWVDMGSSFLPSEVNAAFLWAQLENLDTIQAKRKALWQRYLELLKPLADKGCFQLPDIPDYATNNAHMFYLVLPSLEERTAFIKYLKDNGVGAVFHYLSLHSSEYYKSRHDGRELPQCDRYADCLVRLPLFYDLTQEQVRYICDLISTYYR